MRSYRNLKDFAAGAALAAAFGAAGMLGCTLYLYNALSQIQLAAGVSATADPHRVPAEAWMLRHRTAMVRVGDASEAQP